jgi:hypothetical protein
MKSHSLPALGIDACEGEASISRCGRCTSRKKSLVPIRRVGRPQVRSEYGVKEKDCRLWWKWKSGRPAY